MLYIGAYNTGVWTVYDKTSIVYSDDVMDKKSTYVNFNMIKLKKAENSENYIITGLKPVGENATFESDDLYVLIFSSLEDKTFYENAKLGQEVVVHGTLSEGHANLEFRSDKFLVSADSVTSILQGDIMQAKVNQPLVGLKCINRNQQTQQEFKDSLSKMYQLIAQLDKSISENHQVEHILYQVQEH